MIRKYKGFNHKKYKVKKQIDSKNKEVKSGFYKVQQDKIFLLSTEEYEKYKNVIPRIDYWWWLRSPGYNSERSAFVSSEGSVYDHGYCTDYLGVRPALRTVNSLNFKIGCRVVFLDFPWIKIDENLWIAEVPIVFCRFDKKSNDYEHSEVRHKLLEWYKNRK